ncbi:MAG: stage III sporulation protein AB [Oscillospiraceae bacterium]
MWAHGLGAALLFLGSTAAGFALRCELYQRAHLLAAVIDSLQLLRSDIVGRLLPLPEALRHTAETAPEPLSAHTPPSQTVSRTATGRFELGGGDPGTGHAHPMRAALLTLGAQLGKYDAQLQRQALDTCIASLQSISAALQDDARRRGKLVCGLGATLGLLAAVALL